MDSTWYRLRFSTPYWRHRRLEKDADHYITECGNRNNQGKLPCFCFWCLQCPCYNLQLSEHKQLAEKALEAKNIPLAVVLECLSFREQRVSIDLVRDEVETELQKVKG